MTGSEHCSPRQPDLDVMKQETVGLEEVMAVTELMEGEVEVMQLGLVSQELAATASYLS